MDPKKPIRGQNPTSGIPPPRPRGPGNPWNQDPEEFPQLGSSSGLDSIRVQAPSNPGGNPRNPSIRGPENFFPPLGSNPGPEIRSPNPTSTRGQGRASSRGFGLAMAAYRVGDGQDTEAARIGIETTSLVQGSGQGSGQEQGSGQGPGSGQGASRNLMQQSDLDVESGYAMLKTRPENCDSKKGSTGTAIKLIANFFEVAMKTDKFFQYSVAFAPEEDNVRVARALVHNLSSQIGDNIFNGTMMWTKNQLHNSEKNQPLVFFVDKRGRQGADPILTTVTITFAKEMYPTDFDSIQLFNQIKQTMLMKLNLTKVRRDHFDPDDKTDIPAHRLQIWPGYKTSIRQHENQLLMNTDIISKVFRTQTVHEIMKSVIQRHGRDGVIKSLLGQTIMTTYNKRFYKVDDIDFNQNPTKTFLRHGEPVSYVDYYRLNYQIIIKDQSQPLLVSRPRERKGMMSNPDQDQSLLLIPELCLVTGMSEEMRADFRLMKDVSEITRSSPPNRMRALTKFSKRINDTPLAKKELEKFGLDLSKDLVQIKGRTLDPEQINRGNGKSDLYKIDSAEWYLRGIKLFASVKCQKWAVIYPTNLKDSVNVFLSHLQKQSVGIAFEMGNPRRVEISDTRSSTYAKEVTDLARQRPHMIMVVVPNNKTDVYHSIKKICCVEIPTPTQVITGTILRKDKALESVSVKVAVQMAAKLGAEPWSLELPKNFERTMIVGYDSYHDTSSTNRSVGAVVSTTNKRFTRFFTSIAIHERLEEMHNQIATSILKSLKAYQKANNFLPDQIIIYRDGVGDGQIGEVKEIEIKAIKNVLKQNYETLPKFLFVIVSKRISAKFMSFKNDREPINPPSGTIVDDVVTLPERYDFFLISQSVRQGTVNPTSYNVIEDTTKLKPDHVQRLTYKLCHLYFNWPGTVRVPSVCQYAHKAAFLVGNSIHREPNEHMAELLYYL